ncbi:MAG TPA: tetratricopeptide repeat protein [Terriglobia bacterium]|nr:tetratricopeptide repeat protein [Terriglobia bacterium]
MCTGRRALLLGVSILLLLLSRPVAHASPQALSVSGAVRTADDEPVKQTIVRVQNGGGDKTTDSGEFTIALPKQFKIGFPIKFEVDQWIIIDPFVNDRGRTYLPNPEAETISIKVVRKGDKLLLSGPSIQKLVEKKQSTLELQPVVKGGPVSSLSGSESPASADNSLSLPPHARSTMAHHNGEQDASRPEFAALINNLGLAVVAETAFSGKIPVNLSNVSARELGADPESHPDDFLSKEASELGFTVQELDAAVNQWTRTATDPYSRGLSALNAKRYPEARKYLQESITSSRTDLPKKYFFLAKAEYLEGSFRDSEAALAKIGASRSQDPIVLNYLGVVLLAQAKYTEAEPPLERALAISRDVGDRAAEARTLINIGEVFRGTAQDGRALEVYQQALAISRQVGGHASEGTILNNIGELYRGHGQYDQALKFYEQGIEASREGGDLSGEGRTLNNIGFLYRTQAQYSQAVAYYQQALAIDREAGDRAAERTILGNMGFVFRALGAYDESLDAYRQALAMSREQGDRASEVKLLIFIGFDYQLQRQFARALEVYQQALPISREAHDREEEGTILNNLGGVYYMQEQYAPALDYYQQALAISREIGDRSGEAASLNGIGAIYYDQGQYAKALETHQRSLAISREAGSRRGEAVSLTNIGDIYYRQGKYDQALESYKQALAVDEQILDPHDVELAKGADHIARTLRALGRDREAKEFEDRSAAIRSRDR